MKFSITKTRHDSKSRLLGTKWAVTPGEPFELRDGVDHTSASRLTMCELYKLYWLTNHGTRVAVKCEKEELLEVEEWLKERNIPFHKSQWAEPLSVDEFHDELEIRAETNNDKGMTTEEQKLLREIKSTLRPLTMRFLYDFDTPTHYFFFWEPKDAVMFKLTWGNAS